MMQKHLAVGLQLDPLYEQFIEFSELEAYASIFFEVSSDGLGDLFIWFEHTSA